MHFWDRKLLPIWDSIQNTYWWSSLYVLCLARFEYGTAGKRTPMFRYLFVQHIWGVGNQQGNWELNWELWDFKLSCAFEDCDVNVYIREFFSLIQADDACHYLIHVCTKSRLKFGSVRNQLISLYLHAFSLKRNILQFQFSKISNQFFVVAIARWEALSEASIWAVSKGERVF